MWNSLPFHCSSEPLIPSLSITSQYHIDSRQGISTTSTDSYSSSVILEIMFKAPPMKPKSTIIWNISLCYRPGKMICIYVTKYLHHNHPHSQHQSTVTYEGIFNSLLNLFWCNNSYSKNCIGYSITQLQPLGVLQTVSWNVLHASTVQKLNFVVP